MDKKDIEQQIENRIQSLHKRLQMIADIEANAALVGSYGAKGEFDPERTEILKELDRLCDGK